MPTRWSWGNHSVLRTLFSRRGGWMRSAGRRHCGNTAPWRHIGETIEFHQGIADAGIPKMSDMRFLVGIDLRMLHEHPLIFLRRRSIARAVRQDALLLRRAKIHSESQELINPGAATSVFATSGEEILCATSRAMSMGFSRELFREREREVRRKIAMLRERGMFKFDIMPNRPGISAAAAAFWIVIRISSSIMNSILALKSGFF